MAPLMPLAVKHPRLFIDLSQRAVPECKQNLRHCGSWLIVDSPSDPTGCLHLLLWSVFDSQRDRATLLIHTDHSKNNQKAVEK